MTAAVSARSTLSPNPTVGRPEASSSGSTRPRAPRPPRAGPASAGRPLSWASTTSPAPPSADQVGEGHARRRPRAARPGGTGPPPHAPPGAAAPPLACPRAPLQRTTLRSLSSGTMRSMPSSVSFWTTHSGRSPLTGAKATVSAGSGARLELHGAVATRRRRRRPRAARAPGRRRCQPARAQWPAPVAGDDLLAGAQAQHPAQVVHVVVVEHGVGRVVHEDLGRRGGPHRDRRQSAGCAGASQRRSGAARTRRRRPAPGGETSSPRAAANWRSSSSCSGVEVGRASSTSTCTKRSPRPRPRRWGTPEPRMRSTWPCWVPARPVTVLGARRASRPRPRCRARPGPPRWSGWCGGCRPRARSAGRG